MMTPDNDRTYDFSRHSLHRVSDSDWEMREWFPSRDDPTVLKPGGTIGLVMLTFNERRKCIGITGDVCPGRHGLWSGPGYGRAWFSEYNPDQPEGRRGKSRDYLAQKFLETGFHPERMAGDLAAMVTGLQEELDDLLADPPEDPTEVPGWWCCNCPEEPARLDGRLSPTDSMGRVATTAEVLKAQIAKLKGKDFECHDSPQAGYFELLEEVGLEDEEGFISVGWGYKPRDFALLAAIQEAFARLYHDGTWKLEWDPYAYAVKVCATVLPASLKLAVVGGGEADGWELLRVLSE